LAFSPAGERLAVIDEHALDVFDLHKRKPIQTVSGWEDGPLTLSFDPDPAARESHAERFAGVGAERRPPVGVRDETVMDVQRVEIDPAGGRRVRRVQQRHRVASTRERDGDAGARA
jgi:hypothetical protein